MDKPKKRIFLFLGHPDKSGNNGDFIDAYEHGAKEAGFEVKRMNLGDMQFDPILHHGYRAIQHLEPDLKTFQENIKWCDHFVIFYPIWWASMPALLKGLFERVWLPGFAYRFHRGDQNWKKLLWDKLLTGKTAHVVVTMDNWPTIAQLFFGDITSQMTSGVLGFAGIGPTAVSKIGGMKFMTPERKSSRMNMIAQWGREGK